MRAESVATALVICGDWHITAAPQVVVRTNFLICNMVGSVSPVPHLSAVLVVMLWGWGYLYLWIPQQDLSCESGMSHRSTVVIGSTAAYSPAWFIGRMQTHGVRRNGLVHQGKFKGLPCYPPIILECELLMEPCLSSHCLARWSRKHWLQNNYKKFRLSRWMMNTFTQFKGWGTELRGP